MSSDDDVLVSVFVFAQKNPGKYILWQLKILYMMMNVILFSECGHRISWAYYCTTLAESLGYDTPLIN
jgi:hypothetical protein